MITPTKEQKNIFTEVKVGNNSILIDAKAGCAKTTTIVEATKIVPSYKKQIFLAFNKHIQDELKQKLRDNVHCYTFHGVGMSAIKRKYGDKIKFEEFKTDIIIKRKSKSWNLDKEFKSYSNKNNYLKGIKKLVDLCRQTLTLDKKWLPYLIKKYDIKLRERYDEKTAKKDHNRVFSIMEVMMNDRSMFDFIDMVFLPAIDKSIWMFQYDVVWVDECQDLNRAQQKIIEKLIKKDKVTKRYSGRLIACGDERQAIYGFSGVSEKSFEWFRKFPNIKTLPLTTTFRCAKNIVKEAQKIVPEIQYHERAVDGIVRNGNVLTEPMDGDFVLCRTTAPLIKLFFKYLVEKKKAVIKGSDIGISIISMIDGYNTIESMLNYWHGVLTKYQNDLKKRGILNFTDDSGYVALEDKILVIEFLSNFSVNQQMSEKQKIEHMKSNIKQIFTDELTGIVLSTIHKSKGLEANRVFIARPDKLPLPTSQAWQYEQEKNLEYVAITRAKRELVYDHDWVEEE